MLLAVCLAVHVNISFDKSIASRDVMSIMKEEANAIWGAYGVELIWDNAPAPLSFDVVVQRRGLQQWADRAVLGNATIADEPQRRQPIRISFEAVEALLEFMPIDNNWLRERMVARGLGRVLAHELGHVLLGSPGYHDAQGLMRAQFVVDDLVRPERSRFRLADYSVARLHERYDPLAPVAPPSDPRP